MMSFRTLTTNVRDAIGRKTTAIPIVLGALAFSLGLSVMLHLKNAGALSVHDYLFSGDYEHHLARMCGNNLLYSPRHPGLTVFLGGPLNFATRIVRKSGLIEGEELRSLRRWTVLVLFPICSAISVGGMFSLGRRLGLSAAGATLGAIFLAASFSQVIYGSLPESFGMTGALVVVCLLMGTAVVRDGGRVNPWVWIPLGAFMIGVTVSNVVFFFLILTASLCESNGVRIRTVLRPAVLSVGSVGVLLLGMAAWHLIVVPSVYSGNSSATLAGQLRSETKSQEPQWHLDLGKRASRLPAALGDTYSPSSITSSLQEQRPEPILTLARANPVWVGMILLSIASGAAVLLRRPGIPRATAVAALAILAFNGVLHTVFGDDAMFLYSQHWLAASTVLISGMLAVEGRMRIPIRVAFLALIAGIIIHNVSLYQSVVSYCNSEGFAGRVPIP